VHVRVVAVGRTGALVLRVAEVDEGPRLGLFDASPERVVVGIPG
jgi:hypothetical protein